MRMKHARKLNVNSQPSGQLSRSVRCDITCYSGLPWLTHTRAPPGCAATKHEPGSLAAYSSCGSYRAGETASTTTQRVARARRVSVADALWQWDWRHTAADSQCGHTMCCSGTRLGGRQQKQHRGVWKANLRLLRCGIAKHNYTPLMAHIILYKTLTCCLAPACHTCMP